MKKEALRGLLRELFQRNRLRVEVWACPLSAVGKAVEFEVQVDWVYTGKMAVVSALEAELQ